jgi:hypothetical protein
MKQTITIDLPPLTYDSELYVLLCKTRWDKFQGYEWVRTMELAQIIKEDIEDIQIEENESRD